MFYPMIYTKYYLVNTHIFIQINIQLNIFLWNKCLIPYYMEMYLIAYWFKYKNLV